MLINLDKYIMTQKELEHHHFLAIIFYWIHSVVCGSSCEAERWNVRNDKTNSQGKLNYPLLM